MRLHVGPHTGESGYVFQCQLCHRTYFNGYSYATVNNSKITSVYPGVQAHAATTVRCKRGVCCVLHSRRCEDKVAPQEKLRVRREHNEPCDSLKWSAQLECKRNGHRHCLGQLEWQWQHIVQQQRVAVAKQRTEPECNLLLKFLFSAFVAD